MGYVSAFDDSTEAFASPFRDVTDIREANIVSSKVDGAEDLHKPILDIDLPVKVVPSSRPGHGHLYIDKEMPWDDYAMLLKTLWLVGIIEKGYLDASLKRKCTCVRLPWIKKANVETGSEKVILALPVHEGSVRIDPPPRKLPW